MKIHSFNSRNLALLGALMTAALMATAQPNPDPRPERRPARPEGGPVAVRPPGAEGFRPHVGAPQLAGMLSIVRVLTPEQRESFRASMQEQREKTRELEEKLRDAREDLFAGGLEQEFSERAVRKQAMKVAELEADLAVLRAKALSQIQPPLSREQIEQIKNPPPWEPGQFRGQGRPGFRGGDPEGRPGEGRDRQRPRGDRPPPDRDENDLPPRR